MTNDLREITEHRTVGAVPLGGRYRIIDFMLSNMVNSGIYRIGVLMKDKYQSLIDHISNAKDWDLSRKNSGVTLLPPYSAMRARPRRSSPASTAARSTRWPARSISCRKTRRITLWSSDGDIVANVPLDDVLDRHIRIRRGPDHGLHQEAEGFPVCDLC